MTVDSLVFFFICWGAVTASLFVILYPALSPGWRRTWIGWALFTSSSALALLLDLSVVGKMFGTDYLHSGFVRVSITAYIALGATLKLTALLVTKARSVLADRNAP